MALLAAGCGGDGDGTVDVETGDLSKKEFISKADGICVENRARFNREYRVFAAKSLAKTQNDKNYTKGDEVAFQRELVDTILIPNFGKNIEAIEEIGAPEGDEEEVSKVLTSLQQRLDELEEQPSEISNEMFAKPAKVARDYGLTGCAKSFTS